MDFEKAYKEAHSRAEMFRNTIYKGVAEEIFPDLRESSYDEKIRKELIEMVKEDWPGRSDVIDWIEKQKERNTNTHLPSFDEAQGTPIIKQGEQKSLDDVAKEITKNKETAMSFLKSCGIMNANGELADEYKIEQDEQNPDDKAEPKFKVGDWCIDNEDGTIFQIVKVLDNTYTYKTNKGKEYSCSHYSLENDARFWTIQDAKDGDVLTCYSDIKGQPIEQTGIIKQYVGRHGGCSNSFKAHFGVDWDNNVVIEGYMGSSNIYPSTKEQRDLLFANMKEVGYSFDFEKKELRKLKFRVGDIVKSKSQPMLDARKIISIGKDCYWCEDRGCIGFAWEDDCEIVEQKPAWSEEDKSRIIAICTYLQDYARLSGSELRTIRINEYCDWLKSLRPNHWKPSEERMEATQKLHIYISGPISGYDLEERRKAFMEIEERLKAQGYETVNPMKNGLPDEATTHEHMKRDIELLLTCDRIYFMKKWTHSKGCKLEFDVATAIGLPVMFEEAIELTEFCKMITFE